MKYKNNLINEIQFLIKDFENLSSMEKLYLIDYDRKLVGKSPYYTEKYFTSNFEPSKIYIKKYKDKEEIINEFNTLGRTDTLYCNRIFTGKKTCKQLVAIIKYKEKSKLNPIHVQYEKAYRRMYSKQRRKVITTEEFFIWSEKAKI